MFMLMNRKIICYLLYKIGAEQCRLELLTATYLIMKAQLNESRLKLANMGVSFFGTWLDMKW
eukprot:m.339273 g.339273  ORF g.339273 m.339273 type:complete len:62 (+) comp18731_c0_seq1:49-234(+)